MKTMKRLLALLLALSMVMPNCLTIASAYDEEIVEEVVEELVEEIVETPEEVVEEVFEEVYEEEIYEEEVYEEEIQEEVSEQVAEEVVEEVSSLSSSVEAANTEVPSELETLSWSDPDAEDDSEEQFAAYANGILFPHQPAAVGTAGKDALPADSNALELYEALVGPIKKIADGETNSSIVTVTLTKALDQTGLDNAITALLMDMPFNLYWYDKVRGLSVGISGDQYTFYFRVAKYYATEDITEVNFSDNKTFSGYTTTKQELTGAANAAAQKAWTVATQTAFAEYSGGSCDTPYDRLMAYIEWIEGAVSYDYDALIDPAEFSVGDCNPWQIIYTFDGNPDTNVVCEGYSKSLQYLCEYAASQEIVVPEVFSVTGDSRDTTRGGGGRHMWNIAVLDGKNYLVDVTNADGGWNSILRGVPAVNGSYTYFATDSNGNPITENNILQHTVTLTAGNESIEMLYAYDPETMELFGEHLPKLTLAETDYVPGEEKPEGETPEAPEVNEYPVTTQAELLTALAAAQDGDTITLCQDIDGTYITDKQITVVPGDYADGFVLKAGPGYVAVDNGWRIVKAKAQIGEVYYATLADAMKFAANADQVVTITMLDNDAEPCAVTVPVIIEEVDKYSINLTLAEDLVQSKTDGTLTIGTAEATVGGKGYATLEAALEDAVNGTVTLQKNIVREYPVQVTHKVTIITKGNTVELTAIAELACITTNSGYQFVPAAAKAGNTGYVTLEAALSAVKKAEDKTITLLQDVTEATVIKQEVTINVNGKKAELSTTSDFIHTENGDVHTFVMAKARIGKTNYASLKEALAAAQENDTITLLAAPAAEEKIAQNVKIDLNGVMETVPVADGWEAVKDEDGTWTVQKKFVEISQHLSKVTYQIGLIEPWFLRINIRLTDAKNATIDYSNVANYGAYFIRRSELEDPKAPLASLTMEDIQKGEHYADDVTITDAANGNTYLTVDYRNDIYTYEMGDSIIGYFYFEKDGQLYHTELRERAILDLLNERKNSTSATYGEEEKAVYHAMVKLNTDIISYRSDFENIVEREVKEPIALAQSNLGEMKAATAYESKLVQQIYLIEPWGLKLNARVFNAGETGSNAHLDYEALDDFGIIVYHDKTGEANYTSAEQLLSHSNQDEVYVYSKSNGRAAAEGKYFSATFDKGIYTYELNSDVYFTFFIKVVGETYYTNFKCTNIKKLMDDRAVSTSATYTAKEKIVYSAMSNLYSAVTAYREWYFSNQ